MYPRTLARELPFNHFDSTFSRIPAQPSELPFFAGMTTEQGERRAEPIWAIRRRKRPGRCGWPSWVAMAAPEPMIPVTAAVRARKFWWVGGWGSPKLFKNNFIIASAISFEPSRKSPPPRETNRLRYNFPYPLRDTTSVIQPALGRRHAKFEKGERGRRCRRFPPPPPRR